MNSVNRTQSEPVVTPCTGRLKMNRKCVNIHFQKELCKESEEASMESIGNQPKKLVTQSKTSSENDDDYHDKNSLSGESSYIQQTPKKAE